MSKTRVLLIPISQSAGGESCLNEQKMNKWGVGPIFVGVLISTTTLGILLSYTNLFSFAQIDNAYVRTILLILAVLLIMEGVLVWVLAVIKSRIIDEIKKGKLVTDGIYAWVRHPIYSAFFLIVIGAILIRGNWILFFLVPLYWLFMTFLMKNTEEKWLLAIFGKTYEDYEGRTNRCIPWIPKI